MVRTKKSLGQNFLTDQKVIRNLVKAANLSKNDTVLEIGAGTGVITRELARQAGKVIAVEFDRDLIPILKLNLKGLKGSETIEVINDDILKLNLKGLKGFKIVGSIPYQITSPLIHKLIFEGGWQVAVLLIQKEVAEKIIAQPPKATYLSNFTQAFAEVKVIKNVPKTAFKPQPEVDGAIVKLTNKNNRCPLNYRHSEFALKPDRQGSNVKTQNPNKSQGPKSKGRFGFRILSLVRHLTLGFLISPKGVLNQLQNSKMEISPQNWSAFLHRGFAHPRKMLNKAFPKEVLEKAGINPHQRPQELTITEWKKIHRILLHPNIQTYKHDV